MDKKHLIIMFAKAPQPGRVKTRLQPDFTPEQYDSLIALTVALCREFPNLAPEAPRDCSGQVLNRALSGEGFDAFQGILGHLKHNQDEVQQLMLRLDPQEAKVVKMYHLEGKSYREISESEGLQENSIGPLLSRARSKMRN